MDPADPDVVYVANQLASGLFKSTDGGRTLRLVQPGFFTCIAVDGEGRYVYAGVRFGAALYRSSDGETFIPIGSGLLGDGILALSPAGEEPTHVFAWVHAGGLFESYNAGDLWTAADTGETRRRSTDIGRQFTLVLIGSQRENVYLGHGSVLQFAFDSR